MYITVIFYAKSTSTHTTHTRINMTEAFNARRVKYCGARGYADIVAALRRSKYDPRHNVRRSQRGENGSIVALRYVINTYTA